MKNKPERAFQIAAEQQGWITTKRGWPDFFCFLPDGRIAAVEVKRPGQTLKTSQRKVMQALERAGVPCYRWDPVSGFARVPDSTVIGTPRPAARQRPQLFLKSKPGMP